MSPVAGCALLPVGCALLPGVPCCRACPVAGYALLPGVLQMRLPTVLRHYSSCLAGGQPQARSWVGRDCLRVLMPDGDTLLDLSGTECNQQDMQLGSSSGICPSERHNQGNRCAKPCCAVCF